MPKTITIPDEGFKLIAIAGYFEGKPIWRTVGKLLPTKKGSLLVQLDKVFNPAGVYCEDKESATVVLNAVEYSEQDKNAKAQYADRNNNRNRRPPVNKSGFDDMDDDIPF